MIAEPPCIQRMKAFSLLMRISFILSLKYYGGGRERLYLGPTAPSPESWLPASLGVPTDLAVGDMGGGTRYGDKQASLSQCPQSNSHLIMPKHTCHIEPWGWKDSGGRERKNELQNEKKTKKKLEKQIKRRVTCR